MTCVLTIGATSCSCSNESGRGEVLVPLMVPSTYSLRTLLWCFSISLITLLENGTDEDIDVFVEVPIATNDGYNDC